jgi:predicted dehydrogenase
MISAVSEGRQPLTSGSEARKSLELVLSIHKSAQTGEEVFIQGLPKAIDSVSSI